MLDSEVSEQMRRWFRIPDAALGALAYLGDLVFGLAGSTRRWHTALASFTFWIGRDPAGNRLK